MSKFLFEIKHDPFSLTFCYIFGRFSVLVTHVFLNASSSEIQIRIPWWFLLFSNFQVSNNIWLIIKHLWAFRTNKWSSVCTQFFSILMGTQKNCTIVFLLSILLYKSKPENMFPIRKWTLILKCSTCINSTPNYCIFHCYFHCASNAFCFCSYHFMFTLLSRLQLVVI